MYLLDKKEYFKANDIIEKYKSVHVTPYIQGVLESPEIGKIFIDNPDNPKFAYIDYTFNPYIHIILGDCGSEDNHHELAAFIDDNILPAAKSMGHKLFAFRTFPHSVSDKIKACLPQKKISVVIRKNFVFNKDYFLKNNKNRKLEIPVDITLEKIDREFLDTYYDEFLEHDIKENWLKNENYFKDGIGFALTHNNNVAAFCFSFTASKSYQEINIKTNEKYRRNGFAAITASAFIEECLKTNKTPVWECESINKASIELAKSLGFEEVSELQEVVIDLNF